jgi:hypothetical protein
MALLDGDFKEFTYQAKHLGDILATMSEEEKFPALAWSEQEKAEKNTLFKGNLDSFENYTYGLYPILLENKKPDFHYIIDADFDYLYSAEGRQHYPLHFANIMFRGSAKSHKVKSSTLRGLIYRQFWNGLYASDKPTKIEEDLEFLRIHLTANPRITGTKEYGYRNGIMPRQYQLSSIDDDPMSRIMKKSTAKRMRMGHGGGLSILALNRAQGKYETKSRGSTNLGVRLDFFNGDDLENPDYVTEEDSYRLDVWFEKEVLNSMHPTRHTISVSATILGPYSWAQRYVLENPVNFWHRVNYVPCWKEGKYEEESAWEDRHPAKALLEEKDRLRKKGMVSVFMTEKELLARTSELQIFKPEWVRYHDAGITSLEYNDKTDEYMLSCTVFDHTRNRLSEIYKRPLARIIIITDPAVSDSERSANFAALCLAFDHQYNIFILELFRDKGNKIVEMFKEVFEMGLRQRSKTIVVESFGFQQVLVPILPYIRPDNAKHIGIFPYKSVRDKHGRIVATTALWREGRIFIPTQCNYYPMDQYDAEGKLLPEAQFEDMTKCLLSEYENYIKPTGKKAKESNKIDMLDALGQGIEYVPRETIEGEKPEGQKSEWQAQIDEHFNYSKEDIATWYHMRGKPAPDEVKGSGFWGGM